MVTSSSFDRDAAKARELFPIRRCLSMLDVGLAQDAPDIAIVEAAAKDEYIVVTCNGDDFVKAIKSYLKGSQRKECHDTNGLLILPNGFEIQKRVLQGIDKKLRLDGRKIGWKDVWEKNCCVRVGRNGNVKVTRFPRCFYCEKLEAE